MVWWGLTNPYHAANLGPTRPCVAFTNDYHREEGLHIDVSVVAGHQHQVTGWKWWGTVIRVDNVENH